MLTLLLVDDEPLTRAGILEGIPWKELGIDAVVQADDGTTGLEAAGARRPDIVLTDVRMPCMDGIRMAEGVRALAPDCRIIFMSGYTDKEYLLSAIEMKAVRYVEKPIQLEEVREALAEAVRQCLVEKRKALDATLQTRKLGYALPDFREALAIRVLDPEFDFQPIDECFESDEKGIHPEDAFCSAILASFRIPDGPGPQAGRPGGPLRSVEAAIRRNRLRGIQAHLDENRVVVHFAFAGKGGTRSRIGLVRRCIQEVLDADKDAMGYAGIGTVEEGIRNLHRSYHRARMALDRCFYRGYGSAADAYEPDGAVHSLDEPLDGSERDASEADPSASLEGTLLDLAFSLRTMEGTPVNRTKEFFYQRMLEQEILFRQRVPLNPDAEEDTAFLWETFAGFHTLDDTLGFCLDRLRRQREILEDLKGRNAVLLKILDYLDKEYHRADLTLAEIGRHVYLSPAYLCTYFKQEMGTTIRRHIIEIRLQKARTMLADPKESIGGIARRVGYADAHQLARQFKARFLMTPSEFRARTGLR